MAAVGRSRVSAGILLFRRGAGGLEVLIGHPGGPYFASKDAGHWSIPKGEVDGEEDLEAVARREFEEETGSRVDAASDALIPLGEIVQKGGKQVVAWAVEGDLDAGAARSNLFAMEWPPGSGLTAEFPEIDRVTWCSPAEARRLLKPTQHPFIDRLEAQLAGS